MNSSKDLSTRWPQEKCEEVIALKRQGLKLSEISDKVGIPASTIALILRRAVKQGILVERANNTVNLIANEIAMPADDKPIDPVTLGPDTRDLLCIVISRAQIGLGVWDAQGAMVHHNHLAVDRMMEHARRSIEWTRSEKLRGITLIIASGWMDTGAKAGLLDLAAAALASLIKFIQESRPGVDVKVVYAGTARGGKTKRVPIQHALDMKLTPMGNISSGERLMLNKASNLVSPAYNQTIRCIAHDFPRFSIKHAQNQKLVIAADGQALTRMKAVVDVQRWIKGQVAGLDPSSTFVIGGLTPDVQVTQNVILPGSLSGEYGDGRYGAPIKQVAFLERYDGQRDILVNDLRRVPVVRADFLRGGKASETSQDVSIYARQG